MDGDQQNNSRQENLRVKKDPPQHKQEYNKSVNSSPHETCALPLDL